MSNDAGIFGISITDQAIIDAIIGFGYKTTLDIAAESEGNFISRLSSFDPAQIRQVYDLAKSHAHMLTCLYRAMQARRDPMLQRIPKLGISPQPEALSEALHRALNGAPDFSELFPPRSELYARTDSIQSLFSPGRYATELYKIAKGLHTADNPLNIDNRRPDIQHVILNERALTQKVPALFILNLILRQGVDSYLSKSKKSLGTISYPMNLPYDENLEQIRCAFSSSKISVQAAWSALTDYQWKFFNPIVYDNPDFENAATPSPYAREQLGLMPGAYALLVSGPANASQIKERYCLPSIDIETELKPIPVFTDRTSLTFNQLIDMTAQRDYQASEEEDLKASRYYAHPNKESPVPVTEYGQTYLANIENMPMLVVPMPTDPDSEAAPSPVYELNFKNNTTATALADRAERLLRLQRQTKLDYAQLDWLINNVNQALGRTDGDRKLDTPVLDAIAEYSRLASTYSISANTFACFVGNMNTYALRDEASMFKALFTSPATGATAPLNGMVDFSPTNADPAAALICGGLGVSSNVLYEMARLAFGSVDAVEMSAAKYAQLYRLAIIPRMLGITFPVARILWQLLDPERRLAEVVAGPPTLETLEIIQQTESVLSWMDECQLEMESALVMVSDAYNSEPTPEIFNFLSNIYSTLSSAPPAIVDSTTDSGMDPSLRDMLCGIIAGTFQTKSNVESQLVAWQDLHFTAQPVAGEGAPTPYRLNDFWAEINTFFSDTEPATLAKLATTPNLVRYSNALGQYALIAGWARLTDQDLVLYVETPNWFFDGNPVIAPAPSFPTLLMLSRLKAWQQRVRSSEAEAIDYFRSANQSGQTAVEAITLLSGIQGWELDEAQQMNRALVDAGIYADFPRTFQQVDRLDTWMRVASQLKVGSLCVEQLYQMSLSDDEAANPLLLEPVANSLMSSITGQKQPSESGVKFEIDWNSPVTPPIMQYMEKTRDVYVPVYIAYCMPSTTTFNSTPQNKNNKLYEYLLIDPDNSSQVDTTWIAETISSLQMYINRCLGGYDPEVDNLPGSTMVTESRPGGFLYDWTPYNQTYSTWSGKARLQYYPSIYITPGLRYDKTTLFSTLEQTITQGKINSNRVNEAFTEYLTAYETLADLETISGYQAGLVPNADSKDRLYFIGRTRSEPREYYLRRCNMSMRNEDKKIAGGAWTEWIKIDAPMTDAVDGFAAPFWFHERCHVCWLDSSTEDRSEDHTPTVSYTANIYYFNSDGRWCSFRKIPVPFTSPTRAWCAVDARNDTYILFVEATDDAGEPILYAYRNESTWTAAGKEWAPAGFIARDINYEFSSESQAVIGDRFIVGNRTCTVVDTHFDFTDAANSFIEVAAPFTLDYTRFDSSSQQIGGMVAAIRIDGIATLKAEAETTYFKVKNSDPADYKLHITDPGKNIGFAATYFAPPSFQFNAYELLCDETGDPRKTIPLAYISTNTGQTFYSELERKGVSGLLSYELQTRPIELVPGRYGLDRVPINFDSAYGLYFWEIFFYIAFLIADRYLVEQNYENSASWYQYIFSSAGYRDQNGELETIDDQVRYWNVVPLQEDHSWNTAIPPTTDPDAIAMNDPMHFKMAIFLKTVNMLIEQGDNCYRQLERDMLAKAKMCYLQAAQLLGPRPKIDYNNSWPDPTLGDEAKVIAVYGADNPEAASPTYLTQALRTFLTNQNGNFLPPYNEDLVLYWDKLDVRFYNLRHNLSLHGQPLALPSYATPVSPTELQLRHSAGNGPGGTTMPVKALPSQFRFTVLLEQARAAATSVVQFGASLLATLEKRDNETMTLLLQTQQKSVLRQTQGIQNINVAIQQDTLTALQQSLGGAKARLAHYSALYDDWISPTELDAMNLQTAAGANFAASSSAMTVGAALQAIPNIWGTSFGGAEKGAISYAVGYGFAMEGTILQTASNRLSLDAQYRRRREDWHIQRDNASAEVAQLDAQIAAQTQQISMARKQLELNELERANQDAVYNLQTTRFTGQSLYNWMTGRLSALYYQLYDATLPLCLTAKAALAREIGVDKIQNLFSVPMWNDLYQGLLAGEGLILELQRLENAYLQYDRRGLELQRTASINTLLVDANPAESLPSLIDRAFINPGANHPQPAGTSGVAIKYAETSGGILTITLEIAKLDLSAACNSTGRTGRFYSIAVTLPGLLGPYQDVNATLDLQMNDGTSSSIALSRGLDDPGVFTMDAANAARYLPFEGLPTQDGKLVLSFYQAGPSGKQRPMVDSLTDVIYQLRYTLKEW
ncbi:hypothetical protein WL22_00840 [Burkholderia ubonensis]|uniref:Tc toxin subunit A-related protein n=1 Tax=Burkholderia ubonensis TaxID=101571 RepID=UPI00075CCD36|nr:Tc toxin subunit A [Burkholderia ubonensis]KVZ76581.1 hypothetical protein WL22_00840 [Burkholderia ubonensis]